MSYAKMKRMDQLCTNVIFYLDDKHIEYMQTYGLSMEEFVLWRMDKNPEFNFLYWECGKIPRVEVYENKGFWCSREIRARVYFERVNYSNEQRK